MGGLEELTCPCMGVLWPLLEVGIGVPWPLLEVGIGVRWPPLEVGMGVPWPLLALRITNSGTRCCP